jgi:hypothetical protein
MGNVALLYVGAVLFLNGLMLLGKVEPKSGALLNLFVGGLQVVTPTYLIIASGGDPAQILSASGLYLFGFTYLYVGIGLLANLDSTGVGWFSLFVAIDALVYSYANFAILREYPFGVIWLYWSFLWFLFFLLFGLKWASLTIYTGWVTAIQGWVTAVIPSFLILTEYWRPTIEFAVAWAVFGVVVFAALWPLTRSSRRPAEATGGASTTDRR